jgi:nucleoid DNA-binding protein
LRPKKAKEFIPEVADKLNLSKELVENVVDYYWQHVRKNISSLNHCRVHLTNLGDFVIKHWKIDEKIQGLEKWEESNKLKGLQEITARFKTAETLYNLKKLKGIMEEEKQRKEFIKLHKSKNNE